MELVWALKRSKESSLKVHLIECRHSNIATLQLILSTIHLLCGHILRSTSALKFKEKTQWSVKWAVCHTPHSALCWQRSVWLYRWVPSCVGHHRYGRCRHCHHHHHYRPKTCWSISFYRNGHCRHWDHFDLHTLKLNGKAGSNGGQHCHRHILRREVIYIKRSTHWIVFSSNGTSITHIHSHSDRHCQQQDINQWDHWAAVHRINTVKWANFIC